MGIETMLLAGLAASSVAGTLFAGSPKVPEAETPATPAGAARDSGATVRVGVRDETKDDTTTTGDTVFTEQRKQAKTINGLGRGGLAL